MYSLFRKEVIFIEVSLTRRKVKCAGWADVCGFLWESSHLFKKRGMGFWRVRMKDSRVQGKYIRRTYVRSLGAHKVKASAGGRVSGTLMVDWRGTHMVV